MSGFKIRSKNIFIDIPSSDEASIILDATSERLPHIYASTQSYKSRLLKIWIDTDMEEQEDMLVIEYIDCLDNYSSQPKTTITKKSPIRPRPSLFEEYLEIEAILKEKGLL